MSDFKFCPVCAASLVLRADEGEAGKVRLACPDGHWTHWDNPLPVLAALVEIDGKMLTARNAAWAEGRLRSSPVSWNATRRPSRASPAN
jgi:ribosomal protein S27AE